jgi:hypothetical protein
LDAAQISAINSECHLAFCALHAPPEQANILVLFLLFLQLDERREDEDSVERLKREVDWINKFREMGVKTPKYFKVISIIDEDNQEHYGILVERIHDSDFGVLTPISLNLLIQSTSLFNRSTESSSSRLSSSCKNNKSGLFFKV